jgi:hypothetical protein
LLDLSRPTVDHRVLIASTPAAAWPRDWTIYVYPLETAEAALRAASFLVDICLLIALVTLIITLIFVIATALPRQRGEWERELRHAAVGPSILRDAALHRSDWPAFFPVNSGWTDRHSRDDPSRPTYGRSAGAEAGMSHIT